MRSDETWNVLLLPALLCLIASLIVACGDNANPSPAGHKPASPDKQVVRLPIGPSDFGTLDPALVTGITDGQAIGTIFTGLVEFDHNVQVRDQLAASHEVSSDGLTYTFHLRPNLKFSDGTLLTSQDVVYSINRVLLPATKSEVGYYLNLLKDYEKITTSKIPTLIGDSLLAPDPTTVKIIVSKPAAYLLQALTYPTSYVVEKKLIDKYGVKWTEHLSEGGGDGPFKVQSWAHTRGLVLVPNPNYYGPQPRIQKLELLLSGDLDTTYNNYLTHQIDTTGIIGVPPAHLAEARTRPDFHAYPVLSIRYLTMNYLVKPFDNIHIRQAFALTIDKDLLAKTVFRNAVLPTNHVVPQGMPGFDRNLKGPAGVSSLSGDKNLARQLLQQGMQEEHLTAFPSVTFSYFTEVKSIVDATQAIIQMWQNVLGVTVKSEGFAFDKLVSLESATVNNPDGLQIWTGGWFADYPDAQDWLSIIFQQGSGYNQMNYGQNQSSDVAKQLQVQQVLAQADVDQNQTERLKLYNMAEEQIVDDVGWIPFYQVKRQVLQNPRLVGIVYNALDIIPPDDWGNIYIIR
jgi:oligopeptide transport system substrate-binding protein